MDAQTLPAAESAPLASPEPQWVCRKCGATAAPGAPGWEPWSYARPSEGHCCSACIDRLLSETLAAMAAYARTPQGQAQVARELAELDAECVQ